RKDTTMDQPTEERFNLFEVRIDGIEQRHTEEIKAILSETASIDTRLKSVQENTNAVKIQMEGARADIRVVKANQSDLRGYIEAQFKTVEESQDRHTETLGSLITSAESHDMMLKD